MRNAILWLKNWWLSGLVMLSLAMCLLIFSARFIPPRALPGSGPGAPLYRFSISGWELTLNDNYTTVSRTKTVKGAVAFTQQWGGEMAFAAHYSAIINGATPRYAQRFLIGVSHAITVPILMLVPVEWLRRRLNRLREQRRYGFPVLATTSVERH